MFGRTLSRQAIDAFLAAELVYRHAEYDRPARILVGLRLAHPSGARGWMAAPAGYSQYGTPPSYAALLILSECD